MAEAVTHQGTCTKCGKMVDLVEFDIDPDDAQYITDYYDCSEHDGPDGHCEGSGKSPTSIPALESHWDDGEEILTMGDMEEGVIDPDDEVIITMGDIDLEEITDAEQASDNE